MSDFASVFANMMTGGEELKDARIALSAETFGHSELDARIIDENIQRGLIEAARAIGAALDSLSPRLAPDALPLLLGRVRTNIGALDEEIMLAVFGQLQPTPGCDCKACANTKALLRELRVTNEAAREDIKAHKS